VSLREEIESVAVVAAELAAPGEELGGVVAVETLGRRVYLCAFASAQESAERHTWVALDEESRPIADMRLVREAASLAALCEVAEESAGGGNLPHLRAQLADLREREAPEGIEDAEAAAAALDELVSQEPRLASGAYLDAIGVASRRLEDALGAASGSPFAAAMQSAVGTVEALTAEIERTYKLPLP
jgi:hypothetical protein